MRAGEARFERQIRAKLSFRGALLKWPAFFPPYLILPSFTWQLVELCLIRIADATNQPQCSLRFYIWTMLNTWKNQKVTWTDRSTLDSLAKGLFPNLLPGSHKELSRSQQSQNKIGNPSKPILNSSVNTSLQISKKKSLPKQSQIQCWKQEMQIQWIKLNYTQPCPDLQALCVKASFPVNRSCSLVF